MPGPLPDPTVLEAEANILRNQAASLHQTAISVAHRQHAAAKEWDKAHGAELADATRQAKQAQDLYTEKAQEAARYKGLAERQEQQAKEANDAGQISVAEERTEQAARLREIAKDLEVDAREAQIAGLDPAERVRHLEAERTDIEYRAANTLEKLADQVDEKVRLLAEGAQKQREADAQRERGDLDGAAESERAARYFIDKADTSTIDVSSVDPAILEEAGVQPESLNAQTQPLAAVDSGASDSEGFEGQTAAAVSTSASEAATAGLVGDEDSTEHDQSGDDAGTTALADTPSDPFSPGEPEVEMQPEDDAAYVEYAPTSATEDAPPDTYALEDTSDMESAVDSGDPEDASYA